MGLAPTNPASAFKVPSTKDTLSERILRESQVQAMLAAETQPRNRLMLRRLPGRALAAMPLPTEKRNQGQRDVPVVVQGVTIRPGEWLYADADGIVVQIVVLQPLCE